MLNQYSCPLLRARSVSQWRRFTEKQQEILKAKFSEMAAKERDWEKVQESAERRVLKQIRAEQKALHKKKNDEAKELERKDKALERQRI